jgi:hypothetical protein
MKLHDYTKVIRDERNLCWISIDSGNRRASSRFATQDEAIKWAREHSDAIGSHLVIHDVSDHRVYSSGSITLGSMPGSTSVH